jgi:hypothetical protein
MNDSRPWPCHTCGVDGGHQMAIDAFFRRNPPWLAAAKATGAKSVRVSHKEAVRFGLIKEATR